MRVELVIEGNPIVINEVEKVNIESISGCYIHAEDDRIEVEE